TAYCKEFFTAGAFAGGATLVGAAASWAISRRPRQGISISESSTSARRSIKSARSPVPALKDLLRSLSSDKARYATNEQCGEEPPSGDKASPSSLATARCSAPSNPSVADSRSGGGHPQNRPAAGMGDSRLEEAYLGHTTLPPAL